MYFKKGVLTDRLASELLARAINEAGEGGTFAQADTWEAGTWCQVTNADGAILTFEMLPDSPHVSVLLTKPFGTEAREEARAAAH